MQKAGKQGAGSREQEAESGSLEGGRYPASIAQGGGREVYHGTLVPWYLGTLGTPRTDPGWLTALVSSVVRGQRPRTGPWAQGALFLRVMTSSKRACALALPPSSADPARSSGPGWGDPG